MNKRVDCEAADAIEIDAPTVGSQFVAADLRDPIDFRSRQAERSKMRIWLAACTIAAALAVLLVVSVSVLRG